MKKKTKKKVAKKKSAHAQMKEEAQAIADENKELREQVEERDATISEFEATLNAMPQPDWSLLQRILWVRKRVTKLGKDTEIKAGRGGTYMGITHDKVAAHLRPKMNDAGIVMFVDCKQWETHPTGSINSNTGRVIEQFRGDYEVTFYNAENAQDFRTIRVPGHADDYSDKGPGKAMSYAVKYALLKTFMIETGEDDEERIEPDAGADERSIGDIEEASDEIYALATELFGDDAKRKLGVMARRKFNTKVWTEIPFACYEEVIVSLRSHAARIAKEKELNS